MVGEVFFKNMIKNMKILVIGTGSIGQKHIKFLEDIEVEAEYIFLRKNGLDDELSRLLGATVTNSIEHALAYNPDLSIISTPTSTHLEFLAPLLKESIPVYIEKPVVANQSDVEELRKVLCSLDKIPVTQSGYMLRHLKSLKYLKSLIDEGIIGKPVRAILEVGQWLPDWRPDQDYRKSYSASESMGGGVILDLSHELDMARFLFGDFDKVTGIAAQLSGLEIESEDVASIIMHKNNGPIVTINLDYISRKLRRNYRIIGEKGTLVWNLVERTIICEFPDGNELIATDFNDYDVKSAFRTSWIEFIEAISNDSATSQDINDALCSTELAITAKRVSLL